MYIRPTFSRINSGFNDKMNKLFPVLRNSNIFLNQIWKISTYINLIIFLFIILLSRQ